jgi:dTDP-4-amino-4,6-dideoxygalactose transaminase
MVIRQKLRKLVNKIMSKEKIWLSSPHMGGRERSFVNEAFDTNWVAPLGPNVTGFESDIETYLGSDSHVAALSSGTAALHLALILLGVGQGDEVICQSMTFSASANPIVYQGATPIFVDSELETWNICPIHLEEAICDRISKGKKPKAIIAVHLYGMPYKVDEINAVSKKYDIPIIEDSAESLGSNYKGRKCGALGDISILSFNGNKIITTSGGGALVSSNQKVREKAIFLATQARDAAPHYQHSHIGYNYRLSNICAGIGRGQMEVLDAHIALRRSMNAFYQDIFENKHGVEVFKESSASVFSNHWLSCITIEKKESGFSAEEMRLALENENIESRPLWKPMHLQPIFKEAPYYGKRNAQLLFENGLCLPSGSNLKTEEKQRIMKVLTEFS